VLRLYPEVRWVNAFRIADPGLAISHRPVLSNSAAMITMIYTNALNSGQFRADWGHNFALIANTQSLASITFGAYADESDPGPYPFPSNLPIEGWPLFSGAGTLDQYQRDTNNLGDRIASAFQPGTGFLWETFATYFTTNWRADLGAKFNLNTNTLQRPTGWSSAIASGMPLLPGIVRYDELQRGTIEHALNLYVARVRGTTVAGGLGYIYPASAPGPNQNQNTSMPRYGERIRLKSSFTAPTNWNTAEKTVVRALQKYGAFVFDQGSTAYFSVTSDPRATNLFPNLNGGTNRISITNCEVIQATGETEGPRSPGAPAVNIGADQRISQSASAHLQATITYTNVAPLTFQWLKYSGPGTVMFSNPTQAVTIATFSAPGPYTIEFSADDAVHAVAYDALVVTVVPDTLLRIAKSGTNALLWWSGGIAPFTLEMATNPAGSWITLLSTSGTNVSLPLTNKTALFRTRD
jgi:hypothetical protein